MGCTNQVVENPSEPVCQVEMIGEYRNFDMAYSYGRDRRILWPSSEILYNVESYFVEEVIDFPELPKEQQSRYMRFWSPQIGDFMVTNYLFANREYVRYVFEDRSNKLLNEMDEYLDETLYLNISLYQEPFRDEIGPIYYIHDFGLMNCN